MWQYDFYLNFLLLFKELLNQAKKLEYGPSFTDLFWATEQYSSGVGSGSTGSVQCLHVRQRKQEFPSGNRGLVYIGNYFLVLMTIYYIFLSFMSKFFKFIFTGKINT